MSSLSNPSKLPNQRSRMGLFKIRFGKKLTLKDIKSVFSKFSAAYTLSYSSSAIKNQEISPSSSIRPQLDQSGLFFKDYFYTNMTKINPNAGNLERVDKYNQLALMIRLNEATGVPIPLESSLNRSYILRRYLSISYFDTNTEKIKYSLCEMDAVWDPDNEDIWTFNDSLGFEKEVLVKIGDYSHDTFDQMVIMFEFNITYSEGNNLLEISCGSASLPIKEISRITSAAEKKLEINGGIPTKRRHYKKEDINTRRSTWKKLFSIGEVESALNVEVLPSVKFKDRLKWIDILPLRIICPSSCIELYYCFREYFASNSVYNGKVLPLFSS